MCVCVVRVCVCLWVVVRDCVCLCVFVATALSNNCNHTQNMAPPLTMKVPKENDITRKRDVAATTCGRTRSDSMSHDMAAPPGKPSTQLRGRLNVWGLGRE